MNRYSEDAPVDSGNLSSAHTGVSRRTTPRRAGAGAPPPEDNNNKQRRDTSRDNNRKTEGQQPASDKQGKKFASQIEKDLGKETKKEFHDLKESGAPDRTLEQLKADALDLYNQAGVEPPSWMK